MRTSLVFTFISDDRPGLIESISDTVARHAGNWLDSRMSQLAGKFAGIIRVGVDEESANDLTRALQSLRDEGMSIIVEQSGETFEMTEEFFQEKFKSVCDYKKLRITKISFIYLPEEKYDLILNIEFEKR